MTAFLVALLSAALVTGAGHQALRVARLAGASSGIGPLMVAIALAGISTSALAAWLGIIVADATSASSTRIIVATALVIAALQVAARRAGPPPREPTRSVGATALAMAGMQALDATRFLLFALATKSLAPTAVAVGGALGSAALLIVAAHCHGAWEQRVPLRLLRLVVAAMLLAAGLVIGWSEGHSAF